MLTGVCTPWWPPHLHKSRERKYDRNTPLFERMKRFLEEEMDRR
jgi:hypothetical protein